MMVIDKKEKLKKEIEGLRRNECWVHGEKLMIAVTEPFEGFPSENIRKIDALFPFHALYVHTGCMPLASDQGHGQKTSMCRSCNKQASQYLDDLDND